MTYLQLIKRFWDADRASPFTPCETRLYLLLLDDASRKGWAPGVPYAKEELAVRIGVAATTVLRARRRLSDAGLIAFDESGGGRRKKTVYTIADAPRKGTTMIPFGMKKGIEKGIKYDPVYDTLSAQKGTTMIPFTPIDIDSSYRESNINIPLSQERVCERGGTKEFFVECRDYFLAPERREFREAQERLYGVSDLAGAFKDFYDTLVSEDLLKQVRTRQDFARLFKYKYCIPKQRRNETKRQNRFSERRGTDASALAPDDYAETL